jgi:hypothetical protein
MKRKKIKPISEDQRSEKPISVSEAVPLPKMRLTDDPFHMKADRIDVETTRIALWLPDGTRWEFSVNPCDGSLDVYAVAATGRGEIQLHVMPKSSNTLSMVLK